METSHLPSTAPKPLKDGPHEEDAVATSNTTTTANNNNTDTVPKAATATRVTGTPNKELPNKRLQLWRRHKATRLQME